jgi:hypothetical protein
LEVPQRLKPLQDRDSIAALKRCATQKLRHPKAAPPKSCATQKRCATQKTSPEIPSRKFGPKDQHSLP